MRLVSLAHHQPWTAVLLCQAYCWHLRRTETECKKGRHLRENPLRQWQAHRRRRRRRRHPYRHLRDRVEGSCAHGGKAQARKKPRTPGGPKGGDTGQGMADALAEMTKRR
jgi:hypothetical protein